MMEYWNQGGLSTTATADTTSVPRVGHLGSFCAIVPRPPPLGPRPSGLRPEIGFVPNHQSPIINSEALPRTRLSLHLGAVLHEP
jgi:hypothetical protein